MKVEDFNYYLPEELIAQTPLANRSESRLMVLDRTTGEITLRYDGSQWVQNLYGTIESPTYGKMYTFNDENIDNVITQNMYSDVEKLLRKNMKNVIITS